MTSSPQVKLFLPPHSLTHSPAWLPLEYPAWLGSIFIRRGRKLSSSAQGEGAKVHWENEFSSSRSKNTPFFFLAELRGLPQPLLKLQVELLLPVRTAQGIGRKAQGFARPVESSESLGYISTRRPQCPAGVLFLRHQIAHTAGSQCRLVSRCRTRKEEAGDVTMSLSSALSSGRAKGLHFSRTSGYPSPNGPPKCHQGKAVK